MTPKNYYTKGCASATTTDCITWQGPDIECLGIVHGMDMTEVTYAVSCAICQLIDNQDVTNIDLSCLINNASVNEEDKNVRLILELLLENQCSLKELIDNIDGSSSSVSLTLNLKCLKKYDEFENEIPQDLNQTLQSIVNQVCTNKDNISDLYNITTDLQNQIDNLPDPPDPYTEPIITTCVTTARPLSDTVIDVTTDYCNYKAAFGTPAQAQSALTKQCSNLNAELGSELGWNATPQNLAQTVSNMWITICNLRNRIIAMEQTCCAPSCDKIKIAFSADIDYDNGEVTLNFTSGAGTTIPSAFEDCGTVLTIIDKNNFSKTFSDLGIAQGVSVGPLDLSGLAAGTLTFSFKTKFCLKDNTGSVILTCQDCVSQEVEYLDSGCCTITNTTTDNITVVYTVTTTND